MSWLGERSGRVDIRSRLSLEVRLFECGTKPKCCHADSPSLRVPRSSGLQGSGPVDVRPFRNKATGLMSSPAPAFKYDQQRYCTLKRELRVTVQTRNFCQESEACMSCL